MASHEPVWLQSQVLIAVHHKVLAEHGGVDGVRDEHLLESALARPRQLNAYGDPDLFALAAAYAFGIARNHPFIDGNKRTAFMAAYIFLSRNGYDPRMPEGETVIIMNQLAAGEIAEGEFAAWLKRNCDERP